MVSDSRRAALLRCEIQALLLGMGMGMMMMTMTPIVIITWSLLHSVASLGGLMSGSGTDWQSKLSKLRASQKKSTPTFGSSKKKLPAQGGKWGDRWCKVW